jgi:hypothetical protein
MPQTTPSACTWRLIGSLILAAFISGCASERRMLPELQAWCTQRTPAFGAALGDSSADSRLAERFGEVCLELSRQDGLNFGDGTVTYACRGSIHSRRECWLDDLRRACAAGVPTRDA